MRVSGEGQDGAGSAGSSECVVGEASGWEGGLAEAESPRTELTEELGARINSQEEEGEGASVTTQKPSHGGPSRGGAHGVRDAAK